MNMNDARRELRRWIVQTSGKLTEAELRDDTPLLEQRIITSLQIAELLLFLEELRRAPIDITRLNGAALRDVNSLCKNFLSDGSNAVVH